jgi:hypothetical protein
MRSTKTRVTLAVCGSALRCNVNRATTDTVWSRTERRSRAGAYTSFSSSSPSKGLSTGLTESVPVADPSDKHLYEAAVLLR